jgi:monoterpene epsilon-lactone hydrolase
MTDSTGVVESPAQRLVAGVLRSVLRLTVGAAFRPDLPVEKQRSRLRKVARLTLSSRGVKFSGRGCGGLRGEWATARGHEQAALTFLYLHGGGYCTGSPGTHRAITGHLAARCGARVFAADYRLAPEHAFPAAVDDAVAAYRGLIDEGAAPRDLVIGGDSAGGGLTLAAALRLRELGLPLPRALVLFSPWVDLSLAQIPPAPPGEVMLNLPWITWCARAYVARSDVHHPLISPVNADLAGLPPTLVQVGTDEILLGDSRRLRLRLQAAGVAASYEEFPRRWHVFQASAGVLADADRAIDAVAAFIRAVGPASPA